MSTAHDVESGSPSSVETYARLSIALGLPLSLTLRSDRASGQVRDVDPVQAAMGESEAAWLRRFGYEVRVDEPYQHYQFAGRADVVVIDRPGRALLHFENRSRFPDTQGFAGSFNAKRAYLADDLARRLAIPGGFASQTHVVVALWSAEVLHALRLRESSFRSVCPDPPDAFAAWWKGDTPAGAGNTSALILFDPLPGLRASRRRWVGLDELRRVDPRYRG